MTAELRVGDMVLPLFQSQSRDMSLLQTTWASKINPMLKNELTAGILIPNVALIAGATTINHKLQRKPIGWFVVDINAAATVFRSQPFDMATLTLTSSAVATASIWVF